MSLRLTFHRAIFWAHLVTGLAVGLVILSMAVSGLLISYERQITEWADRGFKAMPPAPGAARLPMDTLLVKAKETRPSLAPVGITWKADPMAPVLLNLGRDSLLYVDPYTGKVLGEGDKVWRGFFQTMTEWHRFLGQQGERRDIGKAITGAGTLAFAGLVISGIYLWWPRHWRAANLRAALLFNGSLRGRARDWNWHNVIGFWSSLPLLVIILTGVIMSYTWANNLLFTLTGNEPPQPKERVEGKPNFNSNRPQEQKGEKGGRGAPRGGGKGGPPVPIPSQGLTALAARAEQEVSNWQSISLRMQGPNAALMIDAGSRARPDLRTMLTLNSRDASVVSAEPFSSYNLGRQLRTWSRWVHTGEPAGLIGQTIAALSTLAAIMLVWTGFALAWRRFFGKKRSAQP